MKEKILPVLLLLVLIGAVAAGWFILPDPVLVQFSKDGATMPKLFALGVSVAIGGFGTAQALTGGEKDRGGGYVMVLLAAALLGLLFFVNR